MKGRARVLALLDDRLLGTLGYGGVELDLDVDGTLPHPTVPHREPTKGRDSWDLTLGEGTAKKI